MKKIYLWFVVPSVVLMLISFSQLMSPVSILEIILVLVGSTITGSFIGFILFLINKYLFKKKVV